MKQLFVLFLTILLLSFTFTKQHLLIGTWDGKEPEIENGVLNNSITFNEDSTFICGVDLDSSWDEDSIIETGTFSIKGDSLYLYYKGFWGLMKYKIEILTEKELKITSSDKNSAPIINYRRRD